MDSSSVSTCIDHRDAHHYYLMWLGRVRSISHRFNYILGRKEYNYRCMGGLKPSLLNCDGGSGAGNNICYHEMYANIM